jgi:hypothetical protein
MEDLDMVESWAQAALLFNGGQRKKTNCQPEDEFPIKLTRFKTEPERKIPFQLLRTSEEVTASYLHCTGRSLAQLAQGMHIDHARGLAISVVCSPVSAAALAEACARVKDEVPVAVRLAVEVACACLRKAKMVHNHDSAQEEVLSLVGRLVQLGIAGILEATNLSPVKLIEGHHAAIQRAIQGECKDLITSSWLQPVFVNLLSVDVRNALVEPPPTQYSTGLLCHAIQKLLLTVLTLPLQLLLMVMLTIWPGSMHTAAPTGITPGRTPTLKTQQQQSSSYSNKHTGHWAGRATHLQLYATQLPEYVFVANPIVRFTLYELSSYFLIFACINVKPRQDPSDHHVDVDYMTNTTLEWDWGFSAIQGNSEDAGWRQASLYLACATALGHLYEEMSQLYRLDVFAAPRGAFKRYLSDEFNFLDICGILAVNVALCARVGLDLQLPAGGKAPDGHWVIILSTVAALLLMLGRMRIFYFFSRLGPFLVMVFKMLGDVLSIVMVSLPLMLSFAYAMQVLFLMLPVLPDWEENSNCNGTKLAPGAGGQPEGSSSECHLDS